MKKSLKSQLAADIIDWLSAVAVAAAFSAAAFYLILKLSEI